jgi:serine phosphatase RsbU (regulator of sigma subunit)
MKNVNLGLKEILGAGSRFNSTALLASYDPFKKTIHYSSAGHDFPLIFRKDTGEIEELESTGTLLGIFIESEYTCRTVQLNSGDLVIFYTDGLVDFFEFQHGAEDGFEYLKLYIKERLEKGHKAIAQELRELILKDKTFLKDDITFLLLSVE